MSVLCSPFPHTNAYTNCARREDIEFFEKVLFIMVHLIEHNYTFQTDNITHNRSLSKNTCLAYSSMITNRNKLWLSQFLVHGS